MDKPTQGAFLAKGPQAKEHDQQNHGECCWLRESSRYFDGNILH